jgi:hypothetical protein
MIKPNSITHDIKKLRQNKQFLSIMVLLFVVLLFWITVSLITSQATEKISPELQKISTPLVPVIDVTIFDKISAKRLYSEDDLSAFTIFKVLSSRDGKSERVVPIEVTIDDLEPKETRKTRINTSLESPEASSEASSNLDSEPTLLGTPS